MKQCADCINKVSPLNRSKLLYRYFLLWTFLWGTGVAYAQDDQKQYASVGIDELYGVAEVYPGSLVVAHANGVLRTEDDGVTWSVQNFPQECSMKDVQFYGGIGILVSACNIWRSIDSGKHWNHVYFGGHMGTDLNATNIYNLTFVSSTTVVAVGVIGAVLRSTDAGVTWKKLNPLSGFALRDVDFYDTLSGLIVTNTGNIHRSSDGGLNWKDTTCVFQGFNSSSPPPYLSSVAYVRRNTCVAVSLEGYIFYSDDNGANWQRRWHSPCGNSLEDVEFIDSLHGVAVGDGGILLYTIDGGLTWDWDNYGRGMHLRRAHFVNRNEVIVVGDGGTIVRKKFDW